MWPGSCLRLLWSPGSCDLRFQPRCSPQAAAATWYMKPRLPLGACHPSAHSLALLQLLSSDVCALFSIATCISSHFPRCAPGQGCSCWCWYRCCCLHLSSTTSSVGTWRVVRMPSRAPIYPTSYCLSYHLLVQVYCATFSSDGQYVLAGDGAHHSSTTHGPNARDNFRRCGCCLESNGF